MTEFLLYVWSPAGYTIRVLEGELPHVGEEFDDFSLSACIAQVFIDRRHLRHGFTLRSFFWGAPL